MRFVMYANNGSRRALEHSHTANYPYFRENIDGHTCG